MVSEKDDLCRLEIGFDSALNPQVTIDDAYDLVCEVGRTFGARILSGSCSLSRRAMEWIFAANSGRDSGGYAADPYRVHPMSPRSWTGRLSDVYSIHEIGHSGQFIFSDNHQSYFQRPHVDHYVEAPSTFNELLLSDYLEHQSDDPSSKTFRPLLIV